MAKLIDTESYFVTYEHVLKCATLTPRLKQANRWVIFSINVSRFKSGDTFLKQ